MHPRLQAIHAVNGDPQPLGGVASKKENSIGRNRGVKNPCMYGILVLSNE